MLTKQTEGIVEEVAKQLQKLTEEVSQLRISSWLFRQADQQKQRRSDVGLCWNCGECGHFRCNCPRKGRERYHPDRPPPSESVSMVMVTGLVADRQT